MNGEGMKTSFHFAAVFPCQTRSNAEASRSKRYRDCWASPSLARRLDCGAFTAAFRLYPNQNFFTAQILSSSRR